MTAAGIARLAGVGRAAVSNWRRRHADFPKPVGGTETSPSFALAEVERWLRNQGKLAEVPLRERIWQQLAGHPAGPLAALVQAGCVLLVVRDRPAQWLDAAGGADDRQAADALPALFAPTLAARLGETSAVAVPDSAALRPAVPFLRGVADLAAELGASQAYEFLLGRYLEANPRQYTLTPPGPAALMAALAAPRADDDAGAAPVVLDPAAGAGGLLCAVGRAARLCAQEADPGLAALTALRLALRTDADVRAGAGDTLRADAFAQLTADAVLCHPPFNERNWGHDELAYDPRWEYGFPARTESELAWVQHALARLRPGGAAVLLMPPAVASRRSGRRVRAGLLRRGALRAVVALPAGAAPPYGIPLHLWVLRKPLPGAAAPAELLFVDTAQHTAGGAGSVRDGHDWQAVQTAVLDAWQGFDRHGATEERPGVSRSVPVVELLDDDVDLAPARHLPPPPAGGGARELQGVRERLADTLRLTADLAPGAPSPAAEPASWPLTTVGELARAGALLLRAGGVGAAGAMASAGAMPPAAGAPAVLTEHDVLAGAAPSGTLPEEPREEPVLLQAGDVVVPVLGGGAVVRVADETLAGAALGRNLHLLRPDPDTLDAWFLAGFLRGTAGTRRASSYASTATRLDVRKLQLPRLPLDDQRRYGERFRALAAFEDALREAGRLGERLVQGLYDGLTDGSVSA
ncbi:N-6 DNA methylase [Streptomyces sp. HNM0663]|uniref:N-6 DNA methylase n=1 Tax=Streptomyces chengmaiensis TaxID=3040919 RepID=A0ABT6HMF9_9ACTN|nr:N-6 DNA methylase [Streptomyces chengmaiensis]MDH2389795.1 N-6 DNA methylase [Streptomyces chengmaiensis]